MVDNIYWNWCPDTLRWDCRFTLAIVTDIILECRFIFGNDVWWSLRRAVWPRNLWRLVRGLSYLGQSTRVVYWYYGAWIWSTDIWGFKLGRGLNNQADPSPDGAWDGGDCSSDKWDMLINFGPVMWHDRMWACDSLLLLSDVCLGYVTTKMVVMGYSWVALSREHAGARRVYN